MLSDFGFRRGGALCRILGLSTLAGLLFVVGCGSNSSNSQPVPAFTITKTHTGNFSQGQQGAAYTLTVSNSGTAATSGTVTVTETVPSGLTLVSMAGTGWTCAAGGNTCTRADALANGSSYPAITVTVNVIVSATSPQVNQVSVSGGGASTANAQDSTTILVPVLSITKTHTGSFAQGQQGATYTVTVSNGAGAAPTNGTTVTVTDTIPAGLSLVSMSGSGWTCPSGGTTCTRSDVLQPGSNYPTILVTVNVSVNAASPQVNSVTVSGGGSANANANDSTTIITSSLSITKTHSGNFAQGQVGASYTVTVSNATGVAPTNGTTVTVTDTVPAGLTPTGISGTGWTCVLATASCTRSDVLLAASSYPPITVTVNVGVSASSPQVNRVSVSGGGSPTANTSDSTIILSPSLSIAKTHSGNFTQGQTNGTYTVTVSNSNAANTGPTNGTPVTVTDTVPAGETLVSMSGMGWTCPTNTCTRTDVLAAGANYQAITVIVSVAANASTPQVNQVSVSGGGSATANFSDSTIIDEPVLSITKTHSGNFTQGQTNATYAVTVMNTGTLPTNGTTVEVADTIPSGETFVSMAGTGWTCPGAGGAATCDRSDVLTNGAGYPSITVTVNVGATASSPQINQVTITGGGSATGNANDSTTITSTGPCSGAGTGSESLLSGSYAFVQKGFDGETTPEPALVGGVLTFNGTTSNGLITAGSIDMNLNAGFDTANSGNALPVTSGSYKVGADHRACLTITTSAGTQHYRASLGNITSGVASTGHMIDFDTAGPFTTGTLRKQSSSIPTTLSGSTFAFGISSPQNTANTNNGVSGGKFAAAGVISFSTATFTESVDFSNNGYLDGNSASGGSFPASPISITGGVYSISNNGRGTITFTPPGVGSTPVHAVIYVVSSGEILILSSDPQASNSLFAGSALLQSGSLGQGSLNGKSVIYFSALGSSGSTGTTTSTIGTLSTNGAGSFTVFFWQNQSGTVTCGPGTSPNCSLTANYLVNTTTAPGRVTLTNAGTNPPVMWLVGSNEAFFLSGDQIVNSGMFEPQTSTASPNATFAFGTINPEDANVSDNEGVATFSSPNITGTSDDNSNGSQTAGGAISATYSTDSTGLVTSPSGCTIAGGTGTTPCKMIFYVISPTRAVGMGVKSTDTSKSLLTIDQ